MGFCCCVPGCNTSRRRNKLSMYRLPKDPELLHKWLQAMGRPRTDTFPTERARICSLHFTDADISWTSVDSNEHRRKREDKGDKGEEGGLTRSKLRRGCIPSRMPRQPGWQLVREAGGPRMAKKKKVPDSVPYCAVGGCANDVMNLAKGVAFFR